MAKKAFLVEIVEIRRKQIILVGDTDDGFNQADAEDKADELWKNDEICLNEDFDSADCEVRYMGEADSEDLAHIVQYDAVTGEQVFLDEEDDYDCADDDVL